MNSKISGGTNYTKIIVSGQTNPLIIQWGYTTTNGSTITFPQSFKSIPSLVFGGYAAGGSADYSIVYKNITTSNFVIAWAGQAYSGARWVAVGY